MENEKSLAKRGQDALEYAMGLEVTNQGELSVANKVLVRIQTIKKAIDEYWDEPITTANKAHKGLLKKKRDMKQPLLDAEITLKPKVGGYLAAEQRKKEAAEREAAAKEAADKKRADEAMEKAAKLEEDGKIEEALDELDKAAEIEDSREKVAIPTGPQLSGMHTRRTWKFRITSPGQIPRAYLMPDERKINQAIKDGIREISGLQIYQDVSVVAKAE